MLRLLQLRTGSRGYSIDIREMLSRNRDEGCLSFQFLEYTAYIGFIFLVPKPILASLAI
jgi:hypothetical protein